MGCIFVAFWICVICVIPQVLSVIIASKQVRVLATGPHTTSACRHIWESSADGRFTVREDTEGPDVGRGTKINIFLKEENVEYADTAKLKSLVERYSEFINFPIYMEMEKEIQVPIDVDDDDYEEVEGEPFIPCTTHLYNGVPSIHQNCSLHPFDGIPYILGRINK